MKHHRKKKTRKNHLKEKHHIFFSVGIGIAIILFFYLITLPQQDSYADKTGKEDVVSTDIDKRLYFVDGNKIDEAILQEMAGKSCDELKQELGIDKDFCIYFEDENGEMIEFSATGAAVGIGCPGLSFKVYDKKGNYMGTKPCSNR